MFGIAAVLKYADKWSSTLAIEILNTPIYIQMLCGTSLTKVLLQLLFYASFIYYDVFDIFCCVFYEYSICCNQRKFYKKTPPINKSPKPEGTHCNNILFCNFTFSHSFFKLRKKSIWRWWIIQTLSGVVIAHNSMWVPTKYNIPLIRMSR